MNTYQGYGFYEDETHLTQTAYEDLYKKIKASNSELKELIHSYYEENKSDYENEEDSFYDFCEEYYENTLFLWHGIEGVIVDFLNEQVYNNKTVFKYEDCCYHVEATLPKDDSERDAMPTLVSIRDIIRKWIAPYYTTLPAIEWKTIYLD